MAVLAELAVKRKEYRQYKIKAGLNVTLGVVGMGAGIASIALSGGGSSLVSLIGIVRGVSEIVQQCKSLYDEAEAVSRKVHAGILASLKNRTENRDVNALLEVGRAVVKSLTTIDFVPTPAKCEELNGTFRIKLTGLDVEHMTPPSSSTSCWRRTKGWKSSSRRRTSPRSRPSWRPRKRRCID